MCEDLGSCSLLTVGSDVFVILVIPEASAL